MVKVMIVGVGGVGSVVVYKCVVLEDFIDIFLVSCMVVKCD